MRFYFIFWQLQTKKNSNFLAVIWSTLYGYLIYLPQIRSRCSLRLQNVSEKRSRWWWTGVTHLCSWILRVITWWTSCNMSATVASGASVTHDRGSGFHLPTWINPKKTNNRKRWGEPRHIAGPGLISCFTFCLRCGAVWVAQRQQSHLNQLVKQKISLDQDKLGVFFYLLPLQRVFLVLHHAEHGQRAPWIHVFPPKAKATCDVNPY